MITEKRRIKDDGWMQQYWRPIMAWQYLVVCLFDFMLAPIFLGWFAYVTKTPLGVWTPLTVQGGGLYHLSMGAIVGITSYAKTQERVSLINSPYMPAPGQVPRLATQYESYPTQTPPQINRPKVAPIKSAAPEI